jgi:hypothetical protein
MLKIENSEVLGWEHAIRGMRNPMNSWEKSDTYIAEGHDEHSNYKYLDTIDGTTTNWMTIGPNDHQLMTSLAKGGPVHAKYRRMITVYLDITAPLYWWKEFDTYKVGTVANSCSTMHKIHAKEFTLEDFSCEHLFELGKNCDFADVPKYDAEWWDAKLILEMVVKSLNHYRKLFLETKDKRYWWQMIQLLPTSYNQKRTVMLNYEVLHNIYHSRKNHKLDEWHVFCDWIRELPYSELITMEFDTTEE